MRHQLVWRQGPLVLMLQVPQELHSLLPTSPQPLALLVLVQRLIIVAQQKVALDGPRDEVLKRLQANTPASQGTAP